MKNLATFVGVCLIAALIGCSSTQKTAVSPGAVDGNGSGCSKPCSSTASPGAVGDAKCAAQCPHAGKASAEPVSPGAVGEGTKKSGCCKSKSTSG